MSCGVGGRHGFDPMLLWLWYRPAAVAPIRPLAWEPPYTAGVALKRPPPPEKKMKSKDDTFKRPIKSDRSPPRLTKDRGVPVVAQWLTNPTRNHKVAGSVPVLAPWVKNPALP